MTDKELDEILNQIKQKNNVNIPKADNIPKPSAAPIEPSVEPVAPPKPKVEPIAPPKSAVEEFSIPSVDIPEPKKEEPKGISLDDFDKIDLSKTPDIDYDDFDEPEDKAKSGKKTAIIIIAVVLVIALIAGIGFAVFGKKDDKEITTKPETETTTEEVVVNTDIGDRNPLTGESDFSKTALNKRPVAVVVENEFSSKGVRPQWGLEDVDICLEGESESSTRLLLFWADYDSVPDQVGPTRSARPPFIHFSQLFNSIFIHAGLSHTRDNYKGADDVFKEENIDHINLLKYDEGSDYFGRDRSRGAAIEHTGYLKGENVSQLLETEKIDTTLDSSKFSILKFNAKPTKLSDVDGTKVYFKWSSGKDISCPDDITWTYDSSSATYKTDHFDSASSGEKSSCEFTNIILLLDTTEYITKNNYKGYAGNSETYCDYKLSGGKGMVLSYGSAVEITWGVENGKLWFKDATGKDVALNPGKSYIGYGSSNNGGEIDLGGKPEEQTTEFDYNGTGNNYTE